MRFWQLFGRAVLLRCPCCGKGRIFRGVFAMHKQCAECGTSFEREPGFFLGAIYFNYGLTALIATLAYVTLTLGWASAGRWPLLIVLAFCLLFPLWFFRYARSLWMAFDEFFDPRQSSPHQSNHDRRA